MANEMIPASIAGGLTDDLEGEWSVCRTTCTTVRGEPLVEVNLPSGTTFLTLTELTALRDGLNAGIAHLEGKE